MTEKYPFPEKQLIFLSELLSEGRVNVKEYRILFELVLYYLNLRDEHLGENQ